MLGASVVVAAPVAVGKERRLARASADALSRRGAGTTFRIFLPLRTVPEVARQRRAATPTQTRR